MASSNPVVPPGFPPVRACLFDMDGLLLDTEDIYTKCVNIILSKYGRPNLPWSIKAQLQGRPGPAASTIFHEWARLPISEEDFLVESSELHRKYFPHSKPLPGVVELLANLDRTRRSPVVVVDGKDHPQDPRPTTAAATTTTTVHIALATSSHSANFAVKTAAHADLFSVFEPHRRVLGDDPRILPGRGKPLPDIYHLALKTVNDSLPPDEPLILPEECLVFEDSVPGVEAGRRAGMRVVWCPHPMLKSEFAGREKDVLAGRTSQAGEEVDLHQVGRHDDGWADYMESLVDFPYAKFGIRVPEKD